MPGLNGFSIAYTAVGGVVLWSGIKGTTLTTTFRGLLSGKAPTANSEPITSATTTAAGSSSALPASDSAIANDALTYEGHAYAYGGAPGPQGTSPWDCSSCANWVLGHDFGMTLPGNSAPGYTGTSHGPDTLLYLAWGSATTVSNSASSAVAGDLLVWQTHMGFATGGGNMISALDESLGTRVTTIAEGAPAGEVLFVRRIKGT